MSGLRWNAGPGNNSISNNNQATIEMSGVSKIYLHSLLKNTLKQLCEARSLEKGGNKPDLADRLERSGLAWGDLCATHFCELSKKHQVNLSDSPTPLEKIKKLIARLDDPLEVVVEYEDEGKGGERELSLSLSSASSSACAAASAFVQAFNLSKDTLFSSSNHLAPHVTYRINQYTSQGSYAVTHALEANQGQFSIHVHDSGAFVNVPFVTPRAGRVELHGTLNHRSGGVPQGFFMRLDVECFETVWQITAITVTNAPLPSLINQQQAQSNRNVANSTANSVAHSSTQQSLLR